MDIEFNDEIIEIIDLGEEGEMIDIEVSGDHLFFANDILTKNSMGVPATADFQMIFGKDVEKAVYESEIQYKIVKNRLGGRVGETSKFYFDARTLKMYDSLELEMWLDDAQITGDERVTAPVSDNIQQIRGSKSKRRER